MHYAGRAKGPISLRFNDEVVFHLPEMKVFDYPEALILVGTDLLGHASKVPFTFAYLGVNPKSSIGEIVFWSSKLDKMSVCELICAPTAHTSNHLSLKKKVTFAP